MTDWIAVDRSLGTLRAYVMSDRQVIESLSASEPLWDPSSAAFETALLRLVEPHLRKDGKTSVVCCGIIATQQDRTDSPFITVPAPPPSAGQMVRVRTVDSRLDVRALPGMSQRIPADVMHGEETCISGFIATHPDWDGVLCLPGLHTKWAQISAGEVVSFRTYITAELAELITARSSLRPGFDDGTEPVQHDAFLDALGDAMSRPERVASALFGLRAEGMIGTIDPGAARARLWGMLIGQELAASRAYWLGQRVALIGGADLTARYDAALKAQGVMPEVSEAAPLTLRGLVAAQDSLNTEG